MKKPKFNIGERVYWIPGAQYVSTKVANRLPGTEEVITEIVIEDDEPIQYRLDGYDNLVNQNSLRKLEV